MSMLPGLVNIQHDETEDDNNKVVWTTEKVNNLIRAMEEGYAVQNNPFFDGDINYKKGNIVYEYTEHEYNELKKCAKDILYFANSYIKVMTDDGYQQISLRPYQERILKNFQENRWSILLSGRQVGKCLSGSSIITIYNKIDNKVYKMSMIDFYNHIKKPTLLYKSKAFLYKIINKLID